MKQMSLKSSRLVLALITLGYCGSQPAEGVLVFVAQVATFLVSDDASYVNGECVSVDGGWNAF